jgi:hypothetical protein
VTKLAVASQRRDQAGFIAKTAKEQNDKILEAMEKYEQKAQGGFVDKKFGKTWGVISGAVMAMKTQFETFVTINEQKVKDVQSAKSKYTSRTPDDVRTGLFNLIAMDKAKSRTEVAQHVDFGFMPREGECIQAISTFSKSKRTEADFKALRSSVEEVFAKTESMVKSLNDVDKKAEADSKAAVIAAFDNLGDEGEFVQKVMKFGTHWGRQRLQADILTAIYKEQADLKDAFDAYEKSAKSGDQDKAFGQVYKQLMTSLVGLKGTIHSWVDMSALKEQQIKDDTLKLKAFMKQ